VESKGEVPVLS